MQQNFAHIGPLRMEPWQGSRVAVLLVAALENGGSASICASMHGHLRWPLRCEFSGLSNAGSRF